MFLFIEKYSFEKSIKNIFFISVITSLFFYSGGYEYILMFIWVYFAYFFFIEGGFKVKITKLLIDLLYLSLLVFIITIPFIYFSMDYLNLQEGQTFLKINSFDLSGLRSVLVNDNSFISKALNINLFLIIICALLYNFNKVNNFILIIIISSLFLCFGPNNIFFYIYEFFTPYMSSITRGSWKFSALFQFMFFLLLSINFRNEEIIVITKNKKIIISSFLLLTYILRLIYGNFNTYYYIEIFILILFVYLYFIKKNNLYLKHIIYAILPLILLSKFDYFYNNGNFIKSDNNFYSNEDSLILSKNLEYSSSSVYKDTIIYNYLSNFQSTKNFYGYREIYIKNFTDNFSGINEKELENLKFLNVKYLISYSDEQTVHSKKNIPVYSRGWKMGDANFEIKELENIFPYYFIVNKNNISQSKNCENDFFNKLFKGEFIICEDSNINKLINIENVIEVDKIVDNKIYYNSNIEDEYLYINKFINPKLKIFLNGKKTKMINANKFYALIKLEKGRNEIRLEQDKILNIFMVLYIYLIFISLVIILSTIIFKKILETQIQKF